jgi:hypothetical protein
MLLIHRSFDSFEPRKTLLFDSHFQTLKRKDLVANNSLVLQYEAVILAGKRLSSSVNGNFGIWIPAQIYLA